MTALLFLLLAQTPAQTVLYDFPTCDPSLWTYVYRPQRLHVLDKCRVVTGTVLSLRREPDGDIHIRVKVDPQFQTMLNARNNTAQKGALVVEPICTGKVTQKDAIGICGAYHYAGYIPRPGDRVQVTGSFVLDQEHGWQEIHPASLTKAK